MTAIALVEDNEDLRRLTALFLRSKGYEVQDAASAEDLADLAGAPNIYVVDINLPETSGYDLIRNLRAMSNEVGILVLSARERACDVSEGYSAGADIYLTKPTDPRVLLAAIQRIEQRLTSRTGCSAVVDVTRRTLSLGARVARLSAAEARLLYQLSLAGERGLERWEIAQILGMDLDRSVTKALEVRIVRLRRKLREVGLEDPTIDNARGIGYRLVAPVRF